MAGVGEGERTTGSRLIVGLTILTMAGRSVSIDDHVVIIRTTREKRRGFFDLRFILTHNLDFF